MKSEDQIIKTTSKPNGSLIQTTIKYRLASNKIIIILTEFLSPKRPEKINQLTSNIFKSNLVTHNKDFTMAVRQIKKINKSYKRQHEIQTRQKLSKLVKAKK